MDSDSKDKQKPTENAPEGEEKSGDEQGAPPPMRHIMAWGVILLMVLVMLSLFVKNQDKSASMNYSPDFRSYVTEGKIARVEVINDVSGTAFLRAELAGGETIDGHSTVRVNLPPRYDDDLEFLRESGVALDIPPQHPYFWQMMHSILPVLLIFGLLYFVLHLVSARVAPSCSTAIPTRSPSRTLAVLMKQKTKFMKSLSS